MNIWHGSNNNTPADVQEIAQHFAHARAEREARINAGLECGRCGKHDIEHSDAIVPLFACRDCGEVRLDLRGCEP